MKKIAVYAGSFDPVTLGHMDIIERAADMFDVLYVSIGKNSSKKPMLSLDVRFKLIIESCYHIQNVSVQTFDGLLVNHCREMRAKYIVRGLRAVTDFEYELGLAHANKTQSPVETVFFPTKPELSFVSSSTVRELARLDGDLSSFVSSDVSKAIKESFHEEP